MRLPRVALAALALALGGRGEGVDLDADPEVFGTGACAWAGGEGRVDGRAAVGGWSR